MKKIEFETIHDMALVYGEPCNNCKLWLDGLICEKSHRQKQVDILTGHIPELTVRRKGGCPDHQIMAGDWWGEDPLYPTSSVYGGTKTNIIV